MQWSVPSETLRGAVWEPALQGEDREECFLLSRVTSEHQGTASVASTIFSVGNLWRSRFPKQQSSPSFLKLLAYLVAIHDLLCSEEQRATIWPRARTALRKQLYQVNRSQTIMQTKKLIFMYIMYYVYLHIHVSMYFCIISILNLLYAHTTVYILNLFYAHTTVTIISCFSSAMLWCTYKDILILEKKTGNSMP